VRRRRERGGAWGWKKIKEQNLKNYPRKTVQTKIEKSDPTWENQALGHIKKPKGRGREGGRKTSHDFFVVNRPSNQSTLPQEEKKGRSSWKHGTVAWKKKKRGGGNVSSKPIKNPIAGNRRIKRKKMENRKPH